MRGKPKQHAEANRYAIRKPWQPRCCQCGKILDHRTVKPKGQPRRCRSCETQAEMALYFDLTRRLA